jgi:hypothetical protein
MSGDNGGKKDDPTTAVAVVGGCGGGKYGSFELHTLSGLSMTVRRRGFRCKSFWTSGGNGGKLIIWFWLLHGSWHVWNWVWGSYIHWVVGFKAGGAGIEQLSSNTWLGCQYSTYGSGVQHVTGSTHGCSSKHGIVS